jgi:hypothetical protein
LPYKDIEIRRMKGREHYLKNIVKCKESVRRYNQTHKEGRRAERKRYNVKIRSMWGTTDVKVPWSKAMELERHVISKLVDYGFYDVFECSDRFLGDCIATKDSRNCLIEITCAITHRIHRHKALCRRLGLDLYVVFISADMTKMILKHIDVYGKAKNVWIRNMDITIAGQQKGVMVERA